jgi:hypothetical protein
MKYIALVYYQEDIMNAMTQKEWDSLNHECMDCSERLTQSKNLIGGSPLQQVSTATTVRVREGKVLTIDGPFAETKEQLAGFYLLEADDLNHAIQIAGKIPPARFGSIEIRPVRELQDENNTAGGNG